MKCLQSDVVFRVFIPIEQTVNNMLKEKLANKPVMASLHRNCAKNKSASDRNALIKDESWTKSKIFLKYGKGRGMRQ